jgi:hypothetical protein
MRAKILWWWAIRVSAKVAGACFASIGLFSWLGYAFIEENQDIAGGINAFVVGSSFLYIGIMLLRYRAEASREIYQDNNTTRRIKKAPGSSLLTLVDFFYAPKTVSEVFEQIVANWREEYYEALKKKRGLKARWINVRYTYRFMLAMGLSKVFSVIKSFKSVIK